MLVMTPTTSLINIQNYSHPFISSVKCHQLCLTNSVVYIHGKSAGSMLHYCQIWRFLFELSLSLFVKSPLPKHVKSLVVCLVLSPVSSQPCQFSNLQTFKFCTLQLRVSQTIYPAFFTSLMQTPVFSF